MASNVTTGTVADLDPFTEVYKTIWAKLRASTNWMHALQSAGLQPRQLQPGNLRDLTADVFAKATPKNTVDPGSLPEVSLIQAAFAFSPFGSNSKIADITQTYPLVAVTETLDVEPLNRIKLFTGAALMRAGDTLGLSYVRGWQFSSAYDGQNPLIAPGVTATRGNTWRQVTLLNITVSMYVSRTILDGLGV
jgi:hypothetical protein